MLSKQKLAALGRRHWKNVTLSQANAIRELFEHLESETESERIVKRAFARIRNRPKTKSIRSASVYSSNRSDDGRETIIATDAFERTHHFTL